MKNLELLGIYISVVAFKQQATIEHTGKKGDSIETVFLSKDDYKAARREMVEDDNR